MIYISLGSNLGDRLGYFRRGVALLKERCLSNITCSVVLETTAIVPEGAPASWAKPYLNMIVRGKSPLPPAELLACLKKIERDLGRPAVYERWAPRVIDLDILLYDEQIIQTPTLVVPHGELLNRPFFVHLIALMDPLCRHPLAKKTFGALASGMPELPACFTQSMALHPQLVGVVNITPDSFSDGGQFLSPDKAIQQALELSTQGAAVIELGAQSTRPGATLLKPDEEFSRLKPVLDGLHTAMKAGDVTISIDSFSPDVIQKILKTYPVAWINDVTGHLDDQTLKIIASHGCSLVTMHALTVPPKKEVCLSDDENPVEAVNEWMKKSVQHLTSCGFSHDKVILDPGIGFGKSIYQNLALLRHIKDLNTLGCRLLVGHSRKSFMAAFSATPAPERDLETIAISGLLNTVDYLRVHNVRDHQRFLAAQQVV